MLLPISLITLLQVDQFALELANHPYQQQVSYVGYFYPHKLRSATKNKPSAYQHPSIVDSCLANEVALGRVAAPLVHLPIPNLHISSFGVNLRESSQGSGT